MWTAKKNLYLSTIANYVHMYHVHWEPRVTKCIYTICNIYEYLWIIYVKLQMLLYINIFGNMHFIQKNIYYIIKFE